jgi:hypothetical protein
MINECGAVGGIKIDEGKNQIFWRKSAHSATMIISATNPRQTDMELNLGYCSMKPEL